MNYYCDKSPPTREWDKLMSGSKRVLFDGGFYLADSKVLVTKGVIFIHRSYFGEASIPKLPAILDHYPELIVIFVSGGTQTTPEGCSHARLYFRRQLVNEGMDNAFKVCVDRFVEHCSGATFVTPDFHFLDPDLSPIFALSLLCEAWIMCNVHPEKIPSDIVIHAPSSPAEWFAPFAESVAALDAAGKMTENSGNSAKIANLMGNAHDDVKSFYDKLAKLHDSGKGKVPKDMLRGDVDSLVTKLKKAVTV